jgi:5-methylcytosine-specific restriction endonuclease McrA
MLKRTELKRKPFRKAPRAEILAKALKRAARAKANKASERKTRRKRKTIDRDAIFVRDRGVCQVCGINIALVGEWLRSFPSAWDVATVYGAEDRHTRASMHGNLLGRHRARARVLLGRLWGVVLAHGASLYEIDHIVPVAENGSDDPSNLRTLCRRCHRIESAALNNRLRSRPTKGVGRGF